jgi:branched-chain amino acid transport system permease protein
VTGLARVDLGLPFYLSAPAGAAAATLIGLCLAFPALRVSGVYLAFATTAFAWIASWTFLHWETVTRGAGGVSLPPLDFGGHFDSERGVYYLSLVVLLFVLVGSRRLIGSRIGRGLVALREGEIAAQSLGINIVKYKSLAFGISSFLAGVAGALYTASLNFVSPDTFTVFHMVLQMAMVVVGGMGSFAGPIVGTALLIVVQELMRDLVGLHEVVFGAVLLGFVAFLPQGLVPLIERKFRSFRQPLAGAR